MLQMAGGQLGADLEQEQQQQQQQQQQPGETQEEAQEADMDDMDDTGGPARADAGPDAGTQAAPLSPATPEELLRPLKEWPVLEGPALKKLRATSGAATSQASQASQSGVHSTCPTPVAPVPTSDEALADVLRRARRVVPELAKNGS